VEWLQPHVIGKEIVGAKNKKRSAFHLSVLNLGLCRWIKVLSFNDPIINHTNFHTWDTCSSLYTVLAVHDCHQHAHTHILLPLFDIQKKDKKKSCRSGTARIEPLPPVGEVGQSAASWSPHPFLLYKTMEEMEPRVSGTATWWRGSKKKKPLTNQR
jgi:hypothetical protein